MFLHIKYTFPVNFHYGGQVLYTTKLVIREFCMRLTGASISTFHTRIKNYFGGLHESMNES